MATALARAIAGAQAGATFTAFDLNPDQIERFSRDLPGFVPADSNRAVADAADVTFLAVKPQVFPDVLPELERSTGLFVSIAAGIRLATIEHALPLARVVRVMPNAPGLVGEMAAGYAGGSRTEPADLALVGRLLSRAGVAFELPEEKLDAVTGLSGSGPAFVARLVEAFTEAGVQEGLDRDIAFRLTLATFSGTARLLSEHALEPDELVTMVSSPGGTTIAGRNVIEASDYRDIIARTVAAAVARSRELGA